MNVDGSVAIVTGAAGGIGSALARGLIAGGGRVVATDLDEQALTRAAAEVDPTGDNVATLAGDAGSPDHIDATIALAQSRFGPVDMYVANAGIGGRPGLSATDADWDVALNVNVLAHVRAARRLVPEWVERGGGYFVSTASAAGLLTQIGSAIYSTTKHAAVAFSEWLSVTYGDAGVKVSCLCPMGVDTALLRPTTEPDDQDALLMQRAVETAGRVLTPDECAEVVLAAIADEHFLILPHPEVLEMYRNKGADYDRWLRGMRRYQHTLRGQLADA